MDQLAKLFVIYALLFLGLLAPKLSPLALYLSPNIMAVVICTGADMVTIYIGADGQPVEVSEVELAACVLADPSAVADYVYARWTQAPRTCRARFVENTSALRTEAERGLLPALRGPPFVI